MNLNALKATRRRGVGKKKQNVVSLNPEVAAEDQRQYAIFCKDLDLKARLEVFWNVVLFSGEGLRTGELAPTKFKYFLKHSNYSIRESDFHEAFGHFEAIVADEAYADFVGFVKCLFHCSISRFELEPSDHNIGLRRLTDEVLDPYVEKIRRIHNVQGDGDDSLYLEHPDVDRTLFVYFDVYKRIFNHYKAANRHQSDTLTLQQMQILDEYVEVSELRAFLKDFGFFPKYLSFVEISTIAQWCCFGKIVKQKDAKPQSLNEIQAKEDAEKALQTFKEEGTLEMDDKVVVTAMMRDDMHEAFDGEAMLDFNRFMNACVRLAQAIFNRPGFHKACPTVGARLEEMLMYMAPTYKKIFGRDMVDDCDFSEQGIPRLLSSSPVASLDPKEVPMRGKIELILSGSRFCLKRGSFVRFGTPGVDAQLVRCKEVQRRKAFVEVPPWIPKPHEVAVDVSNNGACSITVHRTAIVPIECTNNRIDYSSTDPVQLLTYRRKLPLCTLNESVLSKIKSTFKSMCSIGQKYNNCFLCRENWQKLKRLYRLREGDVDPFDGTSKDIFFLKFAEMYEGYPHFALDFTAFLKALTSCFFQEEWNLNLDMKTLSPNEDTLWHLRYPEVAEFTYETKPKKINEELCVPSELMLAREWLSRIAEHVTGQLDVFSGPIRCGQLVDGPGPITGASALFYLSKHTMHHQSLSYCHFETDLLNEAKIIDHIRSSHSFAHAVDRLLLCGLDMSSHCSDYWRTSRLPPGRCYTVHNSSQDRIGVVWDCPGQFACLRWQPLLTEARHNALTVCLYIEEEDDIFALIFYAWRKSAQICAFRNRLEKINCSLVPKFYLAIN